MQPHKEILILCAASLAFLFIGLAEAVMSTPTLFPWQTFGGRSLVGCVVGMVMFLIIRGISWLRSKT